MIIEEYILIGVGYRNLKHLTVLGYDAKVGMNISVLSTHLCETSNTIIHAKCDICSEETQLKKTNYTKSLKSHNYYCCPKCAIYKVKETFLKKYGVNNVFQLESIKDKIKETNIEKYGVKSPQQSDEIKKKTEETNLKKYGVSHTFQSVEVKEKIKKSILNKYGVEYISQSEKIKNKIKKTNIERYGVECVASSEKFKKSIFNRYGVEYVFQSEEIKDKVKKTNLERYGFEIPMRNEEIKEKYRKSIFEKYGCIHPMQNDKIFEKTLKNSYQTKYFNNLKYKGTYELNFIKRYEYLNIQNCKSIDYFYDDKKRKYFPDFYYEEKNLIIEIKSDYTYNIFLEKNLAKQEACLEQGFNFIFIIDKDYKEFDDFLFN